MTDLFATIEGPEDLEAEISEEESINADIDGFVVAGVKSWNGQTGDVVYTEPAVPTKVSELDNDAGYLTEAPVRSVNGQTGDVTVLSPTKTSQLQNDSGFITSEDVPTKISQLQNDSGFITSAGAPVQSVNGQTGNVLVTEGLPPLVGLCTNITPTQVLAALQEGRAITLTYIDNTYGPLTFNYFIYAMGMNLVFAQTMIFLVGGAYSATINGDLTTDTWSMTMGHMMMHSSLHVGYGSVPNVTNAGSADTWAFVYDDSTEEIIISGANGTAPTLGTDIQVLTSAVLQED